MAKPRGRLIELQGATATTTTGSQVARATQSRSQAETSARVLTLPSGAFAFKLSLVCLPLTLIRGGRRDSGGLHMSTAELRPT